GQTEACAACRPSRTARLWRFRPHEAALALCGESGQVACHPFTLPVCTVTQYTSSVLWCHQDHCSRHRGLFLRSRPPDQFPRRTALGHLRVTQPQAPFERVNAITGCRACPTRRSAWSMRNQGDGKPSAYALSNSITT